MINNDIKNKLVYAAIENSYPLKGLKKINESDIYKYLNEELETIIGFNTNHKMKLNRFKKFKVSSSVLEDYDQKIIRCGKDKIVLAGIRHVGGNPDKPFIYIWPGFPLKSYNDIEMIKNEVINSFTKFNPKHINIWISKYSEIYEEIAYRNTPTQKLYLAEIPNSLRIKNSKKNRLGSIARIINDDYYKWYQEEYKTFHSNNQELKDWITINSFELMEKSRNENLLFYYIIDGKIIGLIAGEYRSIFNKKSIYINEILISEKYRGKKYGNSLIQEFIEQTRNKVNYIWSHIDSRNIASIKTALSIGQVPISEEFFIQI